MNISFKLFFIVFLVGVNCGNWHIFDSAFTDQTFEDNVLEGWNASGFVNGEKSTCLGVDYVGGWNVAATGASLQRTFSGLPSHYKVRVTATVVFGDSWDMEYFLVNFDGAEVYREQSNHDRHSPYCGNTGWGERFNEIDIVLAHNSDTLDLSFSSTLDENPDNENWGIRNLYIYVQECEGDCSVISEEFNTNDFDQTAVQGWTGSRDIGEWVTDCNGIKLVGGYNKFSQKFSLTKTFSDLPEHSEVFIGFDLFQMDSWDGGEMLTVSVDGQTVLQKAKSLGPYGGQYQCVQSNASYSDELVYISLDVPHTASEITISLVDNLDELADNEAWGFRNFRLYTFGTSGIQELTETTFDSTAVTGWTNESGEEYNTVTSCGETSLLGGFGELAKGAQLSKTYTDLPEHDSLFVSVEVWFLDTWDNESLFISIDGVAGISSTKGNIKNSKSQGQFCGAGSDDQSQILSFTVPHFQNSATLKITSKLDEAADNESFGIRNVQIDAQTQYEQTLVASDFNGNIESYSEDWTITGASNPPYVFGCGDQFVLGGFNNFSGSTQISRTFSDLPAHSVIRVFFSAFLVDSWDDELMYVTVDSNVINLTKREVHTGTQALCGSGYEDRNKFFSVTFPHSGSSADVSIYTDLDESADNESWGIRDFYLAVVEDAPIIDYSQCVVLYTECNFEGDSLTICEDVPDLSAHEWSRQTKSIQIPKGKSVQLFSDVEYVGQDSIYTESVDCLEQGPFFSLLQFKIKQSGHHHQHEQRIHHQRHHNQRHHHHHERQHHLRRN